MHIERRAIRDLPKDAIVITEKEALSHYYNHIFGTKQGRDIWPLKYGFIGAGVSAFATTYYFSNYYASRVKLNGLSVRMCLNLGLVAVPAAFSACYHMMYGTNEILLRNACTNCIYMKAAMIQNLFGTVYGTIPCSILILLFAGMRYSYPIPGFGSVENMKDTYRLWLKFTKRIVPGILVSILLNTAVITFITYSEFESSAMLFKKLAIQDEELRKLVAEYQEKKKGSNVQGP